MTALRVVSRAATDVVEHRHVSGSITYSLCLMVPAHAWATKLRKSIVNNDAGGSKVVYKIYEALGLKGNP